MPYSAPISRANPACILLLIDQSRSMAEPFVGMADQTKAGMVADAVNRLLQNLVLRSAKADGVRDYFQVGVIGYGRTIKAGLGGTIPHELLVPISRLGDHPLRIENRKKLTPDGAGGVIEQAIKFPVWFDPEANGSTPMCEAFAAAALAVKGFVDTYPNAFPPIVLNLTDGKPSDGNPQTNARAIRNMGTSDGSALVFNLLLSSRPGMSVYFISDEGLLADTYGRMLFRMSSELPPRMFDAARAEGFEVTPKARGVVFNADPTAVVRFLDIGTRIAPAVR
ncbi:MAG: hypothetical protein JWO38_2511 [Gemmataceae bacterium]|nr:hypothetical protein [Gemmataceae bacterium]